MKHVAARRIPALAGALLLAACAATGPSPSAPPEGFVLEGRVAVRYGDESLSGRITWTHGMGRDDIALASPLGNQVARIERGPGGVRLTDANQQSVSAADAETLTEQRLGWRLPLAHLADWARARPGPGAVVERDAAGRPLRVDEDGWRVEFAYEDDAARLPKRLFLSYARGERPLEIRLAVDRWAD